MLGTRNSSVLITRYSHRQIRARVVELRGLAFRLLIQSASVNNDCAGRVHFHMRTIHWPRRRAFEVHAFRVVTRTVTRALEFIFGGLPIGRAAQVRAARVNNEEPVGRAVNPDAVLLLKFRVYADAVIGRIADLEYGARLK